MIENRRIRFWRITLLQLVVVMSLIGGLFYIWKPQPSEAQKLERQRVLNERLFEAIAQGKSTDARLLLQTGAYANYSRELPNSMTASINRLNRESVLSLSIRLGNIDCMKMLLEHGADSRLKFPAEAAEVVFRTALPA